MFAHLNPHSSDFGEICVLYAPFLHQLTVQSSLFEPAHLRPCPSYSGRGDHINLGLWRSFYNGGGGVICPVNKCAPLSRQRSALFPSNCGILVLLSPGERGLVTPLPVPRGGEGGVGSRGVYSAGGTVAGGGGGAATASGHPRPPPPPPLHLPLPQGLLASPPWSLAYPFTPSPPPPDSPASRPI